MAYKLVSPRNGTWYEDEHMKGLVFNGFKIPAPHLSGYIFVTFNLFLFEADVITVNDDELEKNSKIIETN